MNRTFLIFLMIGTALMIAVIGGKRPPGLPGYLPWEVKVLANGNTRIFGITLNKTRIQDANQILSSFPRTRFVEDPEEPGLYAVYDQLNLGGFLARLELQYDLDEDTLLPQAIDTNVDRDSASYDHLPEQVQLALLDSRVKRIRYIPAVDYTPDLILQHFGQADETSSINDHIQRWVYRRMGLSIRMDKQGPEIFSYTPVNSEQPSEQQTGSATQAPPRP
jgi:hypothetical protein